MTEIITTFKVNDEEFSLLNSDGNSVIIRSNYQNKNKTRGLIGFVIRFNGENIFRFITPKESLSFWDEDKYYNLYLEAVVKLNKLNILL